jgi:hypothetical protein
MYPFSMSSLGKMMIQRESEPELQRRVINSLKNGPQQLFRVLSDPKVVGPVAGVVTVAACSSCSVS